MTRPFIFGQHPAYGSACLSGIHRLLVAFDMGDLSEEGLGMILAHRVFDFWEGDQSNLW